MIVNDGSEDNGPDIVKTYAANHVHIKLINQENRGVSVARNRGFADANSKYVYFLDSDDYITSDTLPTVMRCLEHHEPDVLAVNHTETSSLYDYVSNTMDVNNPEMQVLNGMSFIANFKYHNKVGFYFLPLQKNCG